MSLSILAKLAAQSLKDQSSRDLLATLSKSAKNLPPSVERYVEEHKEQGADEGKAWALAWSRYCKYKNPDSPHCKSGEYFHGRGPKTAKKLGTIWLVTDPTPKSEIIDILVGVRDAVRLGDIIRGTSPAEWGSSNPAIHTDLRSAKKDAMDRLKRVHKGDIPDWVIKEEGRTNFKMARESGKLDSNLRRKINAHLSRVGLDGNGRWDRPEGGYVKALDVLSEYGIELGEVVSSDLFRRPSGTWNIEIAFSNPNDPYSPVAIRNSMLSLTYTEVGDGGRYETLAYLS
ncbi:MAG: hypothetical protein LAT68_17120 [Cyclobacteriaceae bacterium]|nr:hypothetical protein [Cyclobacteriaceae bacterium]